MSLVEDFYELEKIADGECECEEGVWASHCISCEAAGAINECAELIYEVLKKLKPKGERIG